MNERTNTDGNPSDPSVEAELTPLEPAGSAAAGAPAASREARGWTRVKAGLLVEQGKVDKRVANRLQDLVVAGTFDADAAAGELIAAATCDDPDTAIERRCADLQRDLMMAPRMRGARGAARKARETGRRGLAYLIVQLLVVLVFALMFGVGLVTARYAGYDLHEPIDALLGLVGLEAGDGVNRLEGSSESP